MATWETFFSSTAKPISFDFHDVQITCGQDVAFATATGKCINIDPNGKPEPPEFRLTMGLRKIAGRWRVMREHHSLPATHETPETPQCSHGSGGRSASASSFFGVPRFPNESGRIAGAMATSVLTSALYEMSTRTRPVVGCPAPDSGLNFH
jgi:hypothetical protein